MNPACSLAPGLVSGSRADLWLCWSAGRIKYLTLNQIYKGLRYDIEILSTTLSIFSDPIAKKQKGRSSFFAFYKNDTPPRT